ncbi:flagellar hook-basal body complex protein FliE [Chromatiales bacterium (ex Bugula neritina AB1)]|nr:flagellar hook-basal body complex protein FliE [Chromatiales bacterium (ex Bugula neritina AB1)]
MNNTISSDVLLTRLRAMAADAGIQPTTPIETRTEFAPIIKSALEAVNNRQLEAQDLATRFQTGDPSVDIAKVMIEMQKARISFEALSQVRNRFVSAYQEIMSMPL